MTIGCEVLRASGLYTFSDPKTGRRLFGKTRASSIKNLASTVLDHERAVLEVLQGLAVPTLVHLPPSDIPFLPVNGVRTLGLRRPDVSYVVETYEGEPFHRHARSAARDPSRSLGTWLFCLEQFVAFRRHQLLYTDIKCANIVGCRTPLRVVIVDFDHVIPLVGRRRWERFGATLGFDPPEIRAGGRLSEAAAVYQLGILLIHFLTHADNRRLRDARVGLGRAHALLRDVGAAVIGKVLASAVDEEPQRRPEHFEELLDRVLQKPIPRPAYLVWRALRAPYVDRLRASGLDNVGTCES